MIFGIEQSPQHHERKERKHATHPKMNSDVPRGRYAPKVDGPAGSILLLGLPRCTQQSEHQEKMFTQMHKRSLSSSVRANSLATCSYKPENAKGIAIFLPPACVYISVSASTCTASVVLRERESARQRVRFAFVLLAHHTLPFLSVWPCLNVYISGW